MCDVPRTSEELPEPSSSPPTSTHRPAVQVNQFSWRCNAKTDKHFHDKRREFVNSDKYSNHASFFPTQQAPFVSQKHLQAVVRKVAKGERLDKSSPLVTAEVTIAGVRVVALIDIGATLSCCRWGWYDQWKNHLGPLRQTNTLVVDVGNVPVELKGITNSLELEWDSVVDHCEMIVLTTLEDADVILGMDIISRLDVQISGRSKDAIPRPESTPYEVLKLNHKVVILAGKSRVFFVANTVAELTLFEPSDRLPDS